jgi:hypothetical protein
VDEAKHIIRARRLGVVESELHAPTRYSRSKPCMTMSWSEIFGCSGSRCTASWNARM